MKARKLPAFEAVRFLGPDPASSRFDRQFFSKLPDAKDFASSGFFGTVTRTDDRETVFRTAQKGSS
jgi:hypothetical protein